MRVNEFNQPIGEDLKEFELPKAPTIDVLEGKYCRLEKLSSHPVSYTHLTLPTNTVTCRSRWSPYH